jgi:hypothetical protein
MNTTESRPEKSTPCGGEHWALFGPPPLFEGEDSKIYDQLVTEIFNAVTPADILEEVWLRDVVDLTIDVLRLRRLKADLMNANALKSPTENLATIFCLKLNDMERIEHLMALAEARAVTLLCVKSTGTGKHSVRNCGWPGSNSRMVNCDSSKARQHQLMGQI